MPEKVPRIVAQVDVRKYKLDPMDGFLLTRIDGKLGPKELAHETGLPDFSVERALEKLQKLGVIELVDPNAPPPKPTESRNKGLPQFAVTLSDPKYDPKELEEECALTLEQRKRVLDLFYRLDDLDHWTLFGITREAEKKTIKRAYFELAAVIHPDKYFKKDLGTFKLKMEALFARITEAHDTLVDPAKRAEYETYLTEVATTRGMEAMLERAMAEQQAAAAAAVTTQAVASEPPLPIPSEPVRQGPAPEELKARREALARRLLGRNSWRPAGPSTPPPDKPHPLAYSNSADAMDALKRRYEERIEHATLAQARRYAETAEEALSKGDWVTAASNLSIAVKFAPNDTALTMRAQEVRSEADRKMCDSYLKQAQYEERSGHWADAARNWQKVARITADAHSNVRAAKCILKAEGDMHQAAEHAKLAISIDSSKVDFHVTLAEIYVQAGLTASAHRAAEAGLQLEPENATLKGILKKTSK